MAGSSESNQNEFESMSHVVTKPSLLNSPSSSLCSSTDTPDDPPRAQLKDSCPLVLQHIICLCLDTADPKTQVTAILNDLLYNLVSDTVLDVHREEKIARMQSAATIAQAAQEKATKEADSTAEALQTTITAGATAREDGTIYIHDNPFKTTPEIICPVCRLPRLQHPVTGANSQPPEPGRTYCTKQPYIDKPGCDIYGQSLVTDKITKKKVVKAAKAKNDPSPDDSKSPSPNDKDADKSTTQATIKCPHCPRYMKHSKMSQHLSGCLGIGGRHASINARGKIREAATPIESRGSTPKPGNPKKRKMDKESDDDDDESTPKKKKKKPVSKKKPPAGKKPAKATTKKGVHSNIQRVKGAEKRLPGQSESDTREQSPVPKGKMKEKVLTKEKAGSPDDASFKDGEE